MNPVSRIIAIYARTSKEDKGVVRVSSSQQVEDARALALEKRLPGKVVVYVDEDRSGTLPPLQWKKDSQRKWREDFTRLIADVTAGKISAVIVRKRDRLARNTLLALRLWELFAEHDVLLLATGERLPETRDGSAKFIYTVLAGHAELEAENTRRNTKAGMDYLKRHDRKYSPAKDLGYRDGEDKTVVKDEFEAVLIAEAFNRCAKGESSRAIGHWLSEQKWVDRRRKMKFHGSHVARLLANPHYIGMRLYEGKIQPTRVYPPIVEPSMFWRVQEVLKSRKGVRRKTDIVPPRLMSGLIYCGECGQKLKWGKKDGKVFSRCQWKHKARNIITHPARLTETAWIEWVEAFIAPSFTTAPVKTDGQRATLQIQLDRINRNIEAAQRSFAGGGAQFSELQSALKMATTERQRIEVALGALPPAESTPFAAWVEMNHDAQRIALQNAVERIDVFTDTIRVTYATHWSRQPCVFPVMRRRPAGRRIKPTNCLTPFGLSSRDAASCFTRDLSTVNWSSWVATSRRPHRQASLDDGAIFAYANPAHATDKPTVGKRGKAMRYQTHDGKEFTADGSVMDKIARQQARLGRHLTLAECNRIK